MAGRAAQRGGRLRMDNPASLMEEDGDAEDRAAHPRGETEAGAVKEKVSP